MSSSKKINWFRPQELREYVIQVSLIILSILVATAVSQCREQQLESQRLAEYMSAIDLELKEEIQSLELNLYDCNRDIENLNRGIELSSYNNRDSMLVSFQQFIELNMRGVFRPFPPSTFENMVNNGDDRLIKDLEKRQALAGAFDFIQSITKPDLEQWNIENQKAFEDVVPYLDMKFLESRDLNSSLVDANGYREMSALVYPRLLRVAFNRRFHLQVALRYFKSVHEGLSGDSQETETPEAAAD